MPIDRVLLREKEKGGDLDLVRQSQKARCKSDEQLELAIKLDLQAKSAKNEEQKVNTEINNISAQIKNRITKELKGKPNPTQDEQIVQWNKEKADLEKKQPALAAEAKRLEEEFQKAINPIGNIVHASVPVSNDEANNAIVKTWGEFTVKPLSHHELLWRIDGYDYERGAKVSGHRGYFLKGVGVRLNYALQLFALDWLEKRKYTVLQTPFLMNKEPMSKTAQLEQFDEELYKVVGPTLPDGTTDDKYLIATSEQPISAFHMEETLVAKDLPLRYAGVSTCFRKEAGSHGRDTWGIFRVHQFEKVEQFVITAPNDSWAMHEEMIKTAEDFYQALKIPYQVVSIVSGALNNAASKKYDLEGWFPSPKPIDPNAATDVAPTGQFRELVSCSNCTDYQSRSLEIKFGAKESGAASIPYVHMLNSTLTATGRGICCILENYQTPDGIVVPDVLQPYMGGLTFLPFVHKGPMPVPKGEKGKQENKKGGAKQTQQPKQPKQAKQTKETKAEA